MTRIKMCGLTRECDIAVANELLPDYIGFVFAKKSKRYVAPEKAAELKNMLNAGIKSVGVFVNEDIDVVADLLKDGVIDVAQLHGSEDEAYIRALRTRTDKPIFQAFRMASKADAERANNSSADCVLVDSGAGGTGEVFDWTLLQEMGRPFFLAGGLNCDNITEAIEKIHPYGVDVSSGIETDGLKDEKKMADFARKVRSAR